MQFGSGNSPGKIDDYTIRAAENLGLGDDRPAGTDFECGIIASAQHGYALDHRRRGHSVLGGRSGRQQAY